MRTENTQIDIARLSKSSEGNENVTKIIKILIVDDDPVYATILESSLLALGNFEITIVSTGKAAIQLFIKDFHFIFCDIYLPDIKGPMLTENYRKIHPKKDTPFICCSSDVEKYRKECIQAGMDDFLDKALLSSKLQEILECWLPSYKNNSRTN